MRPSAPAVRSGFRCLLSRAGAAAVVLVLVLAAIGKFLSPATAALWFAESFALSIGQSTALVLGIATLELLIAVTLVFGPSSLRADAALATLLLAFSGWAVLLLLPGARGSCACFGLLQSLNTGGARITALSVLTLGGFAMLVSALTRASRKSGLGLLLSLALFSAPGVAAAEESPRTKGPQAELSELLHEIGVAAQNATVSIRSVVYAPSDSQPLYLESYSADLAYPCERWERRLTSRPSRVTPHGTWETAMQLLQSGAGDDLWGLVDALPLNSIVIYDGSRTLVAGRSPENWWNERLLTSHDREVQSRAFYGWINGPTDKPLYDLVGSLPYGYSATIGGERAWLLPYTADGVLDPEAAEEVIGRAVPMMVLRFVFSAESALSSVIFTICDDVATVKRLALRVRGDPSVIRQPAEFERASFTLKVAATQRWHGVALPTEIHEVRLLGAREDHTIRWAKPTHVCGGDRYDVSKRVPEALGAPIYFRTDELTGRTWKAEGSGALHSWIAEDERGGGEDEPDGVSDTAHASRTWLLLIAGAVALTASIVLGIRRSGWRRV